MSLLKEIDKVNSEEGEIGNYPIRHKLFQISCHYLYIIILFWR